MQQIRSRRCCIDAADQHVAECERLLAKAADSAESATRLRMRCTKFLQLAAIWYWSAGLGMLAKAAWIKAAECYDALGLEHKGDGCRRQAANIPVHYAEPQDHA